MKADVRFVSDRIVAARATGTSIVPDPGRTLLFLNDERSHDCEARSIALSGLDFVFTPKHNPSFAGVSTRIGDVPQQPAGVQFIPAWAAMNARKIERRAEVVALRWRVGEWHLRDAAIV
jgi:hypothetical protein